MNSQTPSPHPKESISQQLGHYLLFKKGTSPTPKSIDIKLMHGMNRLAILLFVLAVIVLIIRLFNA